MNEVGEEVPVGARLVEELEQLGELLRRAEPSPEAIEAAHAAARRCGQLAMEANLGVGLLVARVLGTQRPPARETGGAEAQEHAPRDAGAPNIAVAEVGSAPTRSHPAGASPKAPRSSLSPLSPLSPLTAEAVATAVTAWERAREARRESWLSYLTHEMKNPLNTVLNALWLLREHPGAPSSARFIELAERGVRRIEATLKDLRELNAVVAGRPPLPPHLDLEAEVTGANR